MDLEVSGGRRRPYVSTKTAGPHRPAVFGDRCCQPHVRTWVLLVGASDSLWVWSCWKPRVSAVTTVVTTAPSLAGTRRRTTRLSASNNNGQRWWSLAGVGLRSRRSWVRIPPGASSYNAVTTVVSTQPTVPSFRLGFTSPARCRVPSSRNVLREIEITGALRSAPSEAIRAGGPHGGALLAIPPPGAQIEPVLAPYAAQPPSGMLKARTDGSARWLVQAGGRAWRCGGTASRRRPSPSQRCWW